MKNADIDSPKYVENFLEPGPTRVTREQIPGTQNLPNIPRAGKLFGETKTNLFINDPAPINKDALNEIDSRVMKPLVGDVPGTFSQPGTSSSSNEDPIAARKHDARPFCC